MPCWLNWYSTGLENQHSERIWEFDSLTRRLVQFCINKIIGCDLPLGGKFMTKNIFDETVETLIKDAKTLTERYNRYVSAEADPNNCAYRNKMTIDTLRLLKDTLSLIKEYDWHLEYSEYETDNHKEIAVWEQNHSGEIRNHKKWTVK